MNPFRRKGIPVTPAMRMLFSGNMVTGADKLQEVDPETGREDWFIKNGRALISVHRDGLVEFQLVNSIIKLGDLDKTTKDPGEPRS